MRSAARRLEPLVHLHRLRRGILKQLLATLRARRDEERRALEDWIRECSRVRAWNSGRLLSAPGEAHGRLVLDWERAAVSRRAELERRIEELDRQAGEAEARLVKASQELKMMATLQARRRARELGDRARREQTELDEMGAYKWAKP